MKKETVVAALVEALELSRALDLPYHEGEAVLIAAGWNPEDGSAIEFVRDNTNAALDLAASFDLDASTEDAANAVV